MGVGNLKLIGLTHAIKFSTDYLQGAREDI